MEDFIKFRLREIEQVLSTHCNEENILRDEAEQLYAKLVNLQAQYDGYMSRMAESFGFTKDGEI